MATSVEDLCNQALRLIGYKMRIGSIYEGSEPAKACLELYGQTRDELLRELYPDFARVNDVALSLLKGPPPPGGYNPAQPWSTTYPPFPWLYEYAYPADCLQFRGIIRPPGMLPMRDPRPVLWSESSDNTLATPARVILTNVAGAIGVYCGQITNPAAWNPLFTATFVESLSKKLSVPLVQNLDLAKLTAQESAAEAVVSDQHRG
jgi:hypothetical protein